MTNLVIIKKGEPRASHREIAKGMKNDQSNTLELIRKYQDKLAQFGVIPFETGKPNKQGGRPTITAFLNEAQTTFLITLMKNTEATVDFKFRLVQEFYKMRDFISARSEAKNEYLPMTKAIQLAHNPAQFFHYSNEADMINHIVVGMASKMYKILNKVQSVRDNLQPFQLEAIAQLERMNTSLIELNQPFDERKRILNEYYTKKLIKRLAV